MWILLFEGDPVPSFSQEKQNSATIQYETIYKGSRSRVSVFNKTFVL